MYENAKNTNASPDTVNLAARVAQLEATVSYLSERQKIIEVFRRYTRGLNRFDMELLQSAFWPDAQVNYGFESRQGDEWVSYWKQERYMKGLACQAHHITNESVEITGDAAHVESYLIAFRMAEEEETAFIFGGRYIDRLDRRNGEWRIAVREFIPHFNIRGRSKSSSIMWPKTGHGAGACDRSDPSYLRPLNPRPKKEGGGD